jgi:hypothetical protein
MDKDFLSVIFWFTWTIEMLTSKAIGLFEGIASWIPTEIIKHNIKYLPQLSEAIPALILTVICAILSALVRRLFDIVWTKYSTKAKK